MHVTCRTSIQKNLAMEVEQQINDYPAEPEIQSGEKKKKKRSSASKQVVIIDLSHLSDEQKEKMGLSGERGFLDAVCELENPMPIPYEVRMARVKQNKEEKILARRVYTKEYTSRPESQAKIKKRMEKPETKQKRIEYAHREDVKERKKLLAKRRREILNTLKEDQPHVYRALEERVVNGTETGDSRRAIV